MANDSKDLDKLVKKCLKDAAFRNKLANDPKGALQELHITANVDKRVEAVRQLSWRQLQDLAESFGYDMSSDAN